jgi:ubiquitin carboxyl-terminal hydrolase 48
MHVGKSAYSGHYLAHIKNFETDEWFSFNDEAITKIKKKQELGCTEDEIHNQANIADDQQATSKTTKTKTFSTANAYLLVYYRKDLFNFNTKTKKLNELQVKNTQLSIVRNDNIRLEKWFSNVQAFKLKNYETENSGRVTVRSIYDDLWCNKDTSRSDMYFVPTDFLRKFMLSCHDVISLSGPVQKYLCSHKRLNPFAINRFKIVNKQGLETLKNAYAVDFFEIGAFKIANDECTRCLQCVKNIFSYLKFKDDLKNDAKTFRGLVKDLENVKMNECQSVGDEGMGEAAKLFWVGKDSLKLWQNLALKKYESQLPSSRFNDQNECIVLGGPESPISLNLETEVQQLNTDVIIELNENDADMNLNFAFNDEIRCAHGNMLPGNNKRVINERIFNFLCKYFPCKSFFSVNSQVCETCEVGLQNAGKLNF